MPDGRSLDTQSPEAPQMASVPSNRKSADNERRYVVHLLTYLAASTRHFPGAASTR
jgi:hypothetical protein